MPYKLVIEGGHRLEGRVSVSGAKNAALPLMAAALLAKGRTVLRNVPDLTDVRLMCEILEVLGARTSFDGDCVVIDVVDEGNTVAPYELVSEMRASFCVLGPLLARRKEADVALPGGCTLGVRPVDLHIKGLKALGAEVSLEAGYVRAKGFNMKGARLYLGGSMGPSVTGTCNILCAAVLTPGVTIIEEAACEPEVMNLVEMLLAMGAKIVGGGTPSLRIEGVDSLNPVEFSVIPDRIEAGTYLVAAAMTQGDITLEGINPFHLGKPIDLYKKIGFNIETLTPTSLRVRCNQRIRSVDLTTLPFPGFPTDLQAQTMALMATAEGMSVIAEKIYPDRFMVIPEFNRMGANIRKEGNLAIIHGVAELSGCPVRATDLRAGAGLVLAGLAAQGTTEVHAIHHIERGYDGLEHKLSQLGAKIQKVEFMANRRLNDKISAAKEEADRLTKAKKSAA